MDATPEKTMDKILKRLMLLLVMTLGLTFASCGGGDDDEKDEPENPGTEKPEDISTVGKLNTVTAGVEEETSDGYKRFDDVTVDVGCTVYLYTWSNDQSGQLIVSGGRIIYAGDFNQLSSVTTAPLRDYNTFATWYDDGCYIILSNTGTYIRLKAKVNADQSAVTFQFQTYRPTNIY